MMPEKSPEPTGISFPTALVVQLGMDAKAIRATFGRQSNRVVCLSRVCWMIPIGRHGMRHFERAHHVL
jgi:hypothetical protein